MLQFKLFDIYTQKWILQNPNDSQSVLTEDINNSLLEKILPPEAIAQLSIANIEMGMTESDIASSHPEGMTLLMAKGERAIYGLPEYRQYLEPYLNLETDYPYHRYLSNENLKTVTTKIKVWVIEDEKGISGIEGVDSAQALEILGDSHGKVSVDLASLIGNPDHLLQYRMAGVQTPFFAKGTIQASLASTLKSKGLADVSELQGIDMILPTSSIKGASKQNLPPGLHEIEVHLANHEESSYSNFTLRSVLEKLDGDPLAGALKQQVTEIESFNETFGNSEALYEAFLKYLEPQLIDDPNNPGQTIPFDPEDWQNCGKWEYIAFRQDYESGHHQLINSPLYAQQFHDFYASRARGMAQLSFVKVRGGMISASHELTNNEICVPYLKDGEKVAAIRSPIIQLPDIALATNKLIDARFNDEGKVVEGMIICSPQLYEKLLNQTRDYFQTQSETLTQAGIDITSLNKLNPFNKPEYQDRSLASLNTEEKKSFIEAANVWREYYNDLVLKSQDDTSPRIHSGDTSLQTVAGTPAQTLDVIRLDTFTAIIKGDFDGDAIAILPQSDYPSVYAGIEDRILRSDSYTEKLDKIKLQGSRSLAQTLAIKSDPYVLGTTANLAQSLQSYALDASRLIELGTQAQKQAYLAKVAPVYYHLIGNPTVAEIKQADQAKLRATFRNYTISSTDEKAIDPKLVAKYDALGIQNQILLAYAGEKVDDSMLDKSLSLWSETLLDLNLKVAQQNQIAVDNFKSEREVDRDFISSLSNRFKPLNDRLKQQLDDEETFKSKLPKVGNTTTNRALLVQNVTQNLVSFQAQASSYSQIQGLFPEVSDGDVLMKTLSATTEYKNLTSAAWHSRKKGQIDKGSSLLFTDKYNRTLEITNLQSYGLTPNLIKDMLAFGNRTLDISIETNPNKNDPHKFFAFYQDKEGKKQKLGTVCNASVFKYDIKDATNLTASPSLDDISFITPAGEYQSKRYTEAADKVVADFRAMAEESGNLDMYAAATYQILTNSNSDRNNLKFMTKAFGAELSERLDKLQLTNLTIGSLTNNVKLDQKNREVYFDKDPNDAKALGVFVEEGGLVQIGRVYQGSFQPRLGAKAMAQIKPNPPATGTFVLADGSSFQIGKMQESGAAGLVFDDEEIEVEIEQGKSSYTPIMKVDGKTIGVIDKKSISYLQDIGAAEKGTKLNLNLTVSGSDNARKIKGITPNGTVLELINISNYLQDESLVFDGREFEVEIDYKTQPATLEAYIYKSGERLKAGEFVYNRQKDIKFVKDRKLVGAEAFTAKLTNKVSTLNITLDPDTIVYPEQPINRFEQITAAVETAENNPFTQAILEAQINYKPTAFWRDRNWYNPATQEIQSIPSLELIVDANSADMVKSTLKASGVEFQQVPGQQSELETRKGFVVFRAIAAEIDRSLYAEIKQLLELEVELDEYIGGDLVAAKYATNLESRYSDLVEVDQSTEVSLLRLPENVSLAFSVKTPEYPSAALLQLIQLRGILAPQEELQLRQGIDRFDLSWLSEKTEGRFASKIAEYGSQSLEEALAKEGVDVDRVKDIYAASEVYGQDYYLSLLDESDWQQLGGGNEKLITEDAELIYQHKINGTDARYAGDLKSVLGQAKYQFYVKQIDQIISDKIEPLVARSGVYSSTVALVSQRPQVSLPMPESLTFGQVPGIAVSSQDSALALYLSNPQDSALADTAHPIDYEGIRHESIQHAFGAIAQTIPQSADRNKQLYALTKNLLIAKFTQYPEMRQQVEENGGLKWLKSCRCEGEGFWAGAGEESALVRLVIQAHTLALKSQVETKPANKNLDPIAQAKADYPPISKGTNLSSYSQDSLGAALSLTTNLALYKKTIKEAYPVSFRGNPYRKFDLTHKAEKYRRDKQQGVPFESAFDAYRHFGKGLSDNAQKESLLTEILQARFEQHPQLAEAIALRGGVSWLEKCEVKLFGEEPYLEGKGKSSGFIRATVAAYEAVVTKGLVKSQAVVSAVESLVVEESEYEANLDADLGYISEEDDKELMAYIQQKLKSTEAPEAVVSNPIASVVPSNSAVAKNMEKDIAMGAVATQFIGTPVRYDGKSSTEKYQQAWGDKANTGKYSPQDIVMVSGNGNWRGVQLTEIEAVFNTAYAPLLDKAIAAKAKIVVGSAQGTDQLVQEYLKTKGYQLSDSGEGYMKATAGDLIASAETLKPSPSVNWNQSTELFSPELKISGKPMQMNFPLKTYGANSRTVDNCFDAMRGHGRTHTTRNFQPHQAYGVREGDIMLAYKGAKDNPQAQIALRVGKQSEITPAMMKDEKFQHFWSNKEKHAPQALPEFFSKEITDGKSVWGIDFEPLGDYRDGKIYDFATGSEVDISSEPGLQLGGTMATDISAEPGIQRWGEPVTDISALPGVQRDGDDVVEAMDISKSIQHLGQLDEPTQAAILAHLEGMRSELNSDPSQYAKGRQSFWLGTQWDLKDKSFVTSGVWNSQLWELVQRLYSDAGLALVTYSGDEQATGINFHRDDSYADFEGRSLSLETIPGQETNWSMKQCYPGMGWVREQNLDAEAVDFSLPSGSVLSFNCKNPHAAQPGAGRWSINIWKVSAKLKDAYQTHVAKQGIDGGAKDYGLNGVPIPLPPAMNITPEIRAGLSAPPLATKPDLVKSPVAPSVPQSGSLGIIGFNSLSVQGNLAEAQKNLSTQEHVDIYQKVSSSLTGQPQVKVLDTIRVWEDPNLSSYASNSLVATLVADEETVRYAAAQAGLAANQSSVSYFMESKDGKDCMVSFDLKNLDLQEIKDTLEIRGFDRFTLIPTPTTTKALILNRNGQQDENIENLIKDYGQPRIYQGTVTILRQPEYCEISSRYEAMDRTVRGTGISDRHDEQFGQSGNHDQLNGGGQLARLEARRDTLKSKLAVDSVDYKIASIATSFIGFDREPSTSFTAKEVVGVSGRQTGATSLPEMKAEYQAQIAPALAQAIVAKSAILLENRAGINKLAIQQLKEAGYAFKQTPHGYISAVSQEKSMAVESVTKKLLSFVLPRVESVSDRQLKLSTKFLPVAVEVLRLGNSRSFENENYRLNLTHPDMVLTVTDKLSQEVVYKTNYDSKTAAWVPDLNSCHLTSETVDVFKQEALSIKTAPAIPLHVVSEKPILAGNRNRFAEELASESRIVATAADFNQEIR